MTAIRACGDPAAACTPAVAPRRALIADVVVPLHRPGIWRRDTEPAGRLRRLRGGRRCRKVSRHWHRNGGLRVLHRRRHINGHGARQGVDRRAKPTAQQQLLPPGVELSRADAVLVRHHRWRNARLHALGHDPALLLSRPPTALAPGGTVGARTESAHMITRRSALCPQRPPRHPVVLRHGQHLAPNRSRRAMWCRRPAYRSPAEDNRVCNECS